MPDNSLEVIINAHSGFQNTEQARQRVRELFDERGIEARIIVAQTGQELEEIAHNAMHAGGKVIVVGGGDGTISTFASAMVKSSANKTLGVLPLGTLNHFAQDLKIPLTLDEAVDTIVTGHYRPIDAGEVNGHIFINNSSLGLYPQIVRERDKQQRLGHGKWPAFVWASLAVFRRSPFLDLQLAVAGRELNCRTPFVFVGNNEYAMEGLKIGRRERLDAGHLSLYLSRRPGRWGLIRLALRALFGHLRNEKDFLAMTAIQVTIASRHRQLRVAFDGETRVLSTPLNYRLLPKALRVIVPEELTD